MAKFQPGEMTIKFKDGSRVDYLVKRVTLTELEADEDNYAKERDAIIEAASTNEEAALRVQRLINHRWLGYVVGDITIIEDGETYKMESADLPSDYVSYIIDATRDFSWGRQKKVIEDTSTPTGLPSLEVGDE